MVRSNSETQPDGRDLFEFVERIRSQTKYFDTSRAEIERELLEEGYHEVESDVEIEGETVGARLRLNITRQHDRPTKWKVALKLHDVRIDGIDFEHRYDRGDGTIGHGWHRHQWKVSKQSAERFKLDLPDFGQGLATLEEFLIRVFKEMRIAVNRNDDGDQRLPLD